MSELEAVQRANQSFYRAFETLDLAEMEAAWAHGGQVTCLHPGWPLCAGWTEVRDSWARIFANTPSIGFEILDERIDVAGDMAWVVCTERIRQRAGGALEGAVVATNVFRRVDGQWRMVHHHGSPEVARVQRPAPVARRPGRKVLN
jgi:ketosteroid isomerase-like protein